MSESTYRKPLPTNQALPMAPNMQVQSSTSLTPFPPKTVSAEFHDLELGDHSVRNESTSHLQHREDKQTRSWSASILPGKKRSNLAKEYSGGTARQHPTFVKYKRPHIELNSLSSPKIDEDKEYEYLDKTRNVTLKRLDVPVYLSTTTYQPRRLLVQCTPQVWHDPSGGDWRRVKMEGSVPMALKMAEWALRPSDKKGKKGHERRPVFGTIAAIGRTILVGPVLQVLMALPGMAAPWEQDTDVNDTYDEFPGIHWNWPKFAVEKFDMSLVHEEKIEPAYSSKPRQLRPNTLVVYDKETESWVVNRNPGSDVPYVFISFTRAHFHVDEGYGTTKLDVEKACKKLEQIARYVTRQYFESAAWQLDGSDGAPRKFAYWIDYQCGFGPGATGEQMNRYINTICDVVRSSKKVIIALPNAPTNSLDNIAWGQSLWTLSEILLANGDVKVCWPSLDTKQGSIQSGKETEEDLANEATTHNSQNETVCHIRTWTKLEMTRQFWEESYKDPVNEDQQPIRILVEHFSGSLTLGRIELFITAFAAFQNLFVQKRFSNQERSYELCNALMAILRHRVDFAKTNTLFHSLARLNMENDSDDFIERMICWAPSSTTLDDTHPSMPDVFSLYRLSFPDQFGSRLWNIRPMCTVVGLAEQDNTIMIDDCRSISIRWKNFAPLQYARNQGFKKTLAAFFVRSGGLWIAAGFNVLYQYVPLYVGDAEASPDLDGTDTTTGNNVDTSEQLALAILLAGFLFAVGFVLSLFAPSCIRRLYGGSVVESTAQLVAFEGTLPAAKIEELIFGNSRDRLAWQPSATPLSDRDPKERLGISPTWFDQKADGSEELNMDTLNRRRKELGIPQNHKIFTLVDTGRLTITTFSAQYPPSVALLCGRDGGMLRAVLCSWDFKNDCLYKEAVVRMPSVIWDSAKPKSWLKLCLTSRKPFVEL